MDHYSGLPFSSSFSSSSSSSSSSSPSSSPSKRDCSSLSPSFSLSEKGGEGAVMIFLGAECGLRSLLSMQPMQDSRTARYSPEVKRWLLRTKKEVGLSSHAAAGMYSFSKKGRMAMIFSLLYSAVYLRTGCPSVLASFSTGKFWLMQSTSSTKKSSISLRRLKGLSQMVCMYMERATSMTASFWRNLGSSSSGLKLQCCCGQGRLGNLTQLPLALRQKEGLLASAQPGWSKNLPVKVSLWAGESPAILQTLQPSVGLQDSMSLVGSTRPLLLLWKQSRCLFFMWRYSAGQLRYCLAQKHSYRGRSLLYLDCDRRRFSIVSFSCGEGSPFYIIYFRFIPPDSPFSKTLTNSNLPGPLTSPSLKTGEGKCYKLERVL